MDTGYVRRGEFKISGKAYGDYKYALKFSKDGDDRMELDNAELDFLMLEPVEVRVGRFGHNFGLENNVSSSWIMGIERPLIYDVLRGDSTNDYGIRAAIYEKQYTLSAGIHHDALKASDNSDDDAWGYTVRATVAPIMNDEVLVHAGFNYHNTNPDNADTGKNDTALGVKKADKVDLFNTFDATGDTEIVLEAAAQMGSLQVQGEYMMRSIDQKDTTNAKADVDMAGYYGQISYMLDGGKRSYKEGAFGKPKGGQWEIFARYTSLTVDAKNGAYAGTDANKEKDVEVESMTLGVNYFATKNIRASLNYVAGDTSNLVSKTATYSNGKKRDNDGTAVVGRIQFVF